MFPLQGVWVRSPVEELKFANYGAAKKKKKARMGELLIFCSQS